MLMLTVKHLETVGGADRYILTDYEGYEHHFIVSNAEKAVLGGEEAQRIAISRELKRYHSKQAAPNAG